MIEQQKIIVNQLMNATGNDGERWKTTAGDIGARMARVLEQEELACEEMRARVVDPLVQFFNEDIQYAQDLKTQYKVAKSDYESALGAFEKAKAANKDSVKIESTEKKCAEQRAALETIKQQFKVCVSGIPEFI